jgi:hypothetical protein
VQLGPLECFGPGYFLRTEPYRRNVGVELRFTLIVSLSGSGELIAQSSDYGPTGWVGYTHGPGGIGVSFTCTYGNTVVDLNTHYTNGVAYDNRVAMTHELGHATGLAHNDFTTPCAYGGLHYYSIMFYAPLAAAYAQSSCQVGIPTSDDISGINSIYP